MKWGRQAVMTASALPHSSSRSANSLHLEVSSDPGHGRFSSSVTALRTFISCCFSCSLAFWVILFRFTWNLDNHFKPSIHFLRKWGYLPLPPVCLKTFRRYAFEVQHGSYSDTFVQFHRAGFFCRRMISRILCQLLCNSRLGGNSF